MALSYTSDTDIDLVFETRWRHLMGRLEKRFEMPMDLDGLLFLIGVQELGQGGRIFTKDEKLGLMHIAISVILTPYGYYREVRRDEDGWPHYERLKELPVLSGKEQERLLKEAALAYFGE
ncbi:MAG TPA: hypothetical protein PKD45_10365 [Flavobacteriales bacterium]|nr:hypothetical protein [Flavobacteriales bacterium]